MVILRIWFLWHFYYLYMVFRNKNNPFAAGAERKKWSWACLRLLCHDSRKEYVPQENRAEDLPPPPLVVVMGPPQSGKSTLIRSLIKYYTGQNISEVLGPITVSSFLLSFSILEHGGLPLLCLFFILISIVVKHSHFLFLFTCRWWRASALALLSSNALMMCVRWWTWPRLRI